MKVSLKLIKKYVDLPECLTPKAIARDLTISTVEVENVEELKEKYENIVVGKIISVDKHPDADRLRVCQVDVGDEKLQIVCGGSNLYAGEYVVVSKIGAKVVWHGQGEPVVIEKTKMRGVESYGMICAAEEVFLSDLFPSKSETEIVDLGDKNYTLGENIATALGLDDVVIEIDNKSLTNRPDLWGIYGIARELSVKYGLTLKPLETYELPSVKPYNVVIENKEKCHRYVAVEIDGITNIQSPLWMQQYLNSFGQRPINAIVDITNYVMCVTGQPLHAFDKTHVHGETIVVRNAKENEELLLLDDNIVKLDKDDLVICDDTDAMALAGIKGGKKDSILPTTTGIVLEVASFDASTIRKSGRKFNEKTDAGMRFEKGLDTQRVDEGLNLALYLIHEIFKDSKIVSFTDNYIEETEKNVIDIEESFLNERLGKEIDSIIINKILTRLGYEVTLDNGIYHVIVPTYRSTGDVTLKDDVLGDIARIIGYDNFERKPLTISIDHAIIQRKVLLERRIKEYLSNRCGFNEIYSYSWTDEKYINAAGLNKESMVRLATPPSPETAYLRNSLIPNMLEDISRNLRFFDEFRMYELAQVYEKGEYHESSDDETLPIHKKMLCASITGKDPISIFYELKGVLEELSRYTHMENIHLEVLDKPSWADPNAYAQIMLDKENIGVIALVSGKTMQDSKIKHTNVAMMELNADKLIPYLSRTNVYKPLPIVPLVEKDLSLIMDEGITWDKIEEAVRSKAPEVEFIEEYHGSQIPEGKKSIVLRVKLGDGQTTLTSEEIDKEINTILRKLEHLYNIKLREE